MSEETSARVQPFYCPYCGEPDIRPGEERGVWRCDLCERTWKLTLVDLGR